MSRLCEVFFAVIFSLIMLWLWTPSSEPKHHDRLVLRSYHAMGSLLGALLTTSPNQSLAQHRDLQYELLAERRAALSLVANQPGIGRDRWGQHLQIQAAGYAILDYCTAHQDRELGLGELEDLTMKVRQAKSKRD